MHVLFTENIPPTPSQLKSINCVGHVGSGQYIIDVFGQRKILCLNN